MRREWYSGEGEWANPVSSWNWARALWAGLVLGLASLAIGFGLGQLTAPGGAEAGTSGVRTDIGDAAVLERGAPPAGPRHDEVAPTDHLVVVQVSVSVCGSRSVGTGVLVADGLVVTAAHVVGDAGLVRIDHGPTTVTGEVLGVVADGRDLAVIAVDAPMAAPLETASAPGLGEPLTLVGVPAEGRREVVVGERVELTSAMAATVTGDPIGVAAEVRPGFSGGPAVTADGTLVGIVVATEIHTDTALVVPLEEIARVEETAVVPGRCPTDA